MNRDFGKAVYYLLYTPPQMPCSVTYPLRERVKVEATPVGCRVAEADQVHAALAALSDGEAPTYGLIRGTTNDWSLEVWAADMLLTCKVGQQFDDSRDGQVNYFLERRSGPIGATLAASITLPAAPQT